MTRIFISYAREDVDRAREVESNFASVGLDVFRDESRLSGGMAWPDVLQRDAAAADIVWLLWSRYAAASWWVEREYTLALERGSDALRIEPLDDTPLPDALSHVQTEPRFHRASDVDAVLRNITRTLPTHPKPSELLRAEFAVAPWFGRTAEMEDSLSWAESESPFAVRLFTAPGGTGKTRFAIELCRRLRSHGWDARTLDAREFPRALDSDPKAVDRVMRARLPRLVVLDYAETRRDQLIALVREGLLRPPRIRVRLLLLARAEGDWWPEFLRHDRDIEEAAGRTIDVRQLAQVGESLADRATLYGDAMDAFARALGRPAITNALPDLSAPGFGRALFVQVAAANAALRGNRVDAGEQDGLAALLHHEERYWREKAKQVAVPVECVSALITTLCLVGGVRASDGELERLVLATPYARDLDAVHRRRLREVVVELYGTGEGIEPLQPDLVGEALVERELARDGSLRTSWLSAAEEAATRHGLTVLDRVAARVPAFGRVLKEVLRSDLGRLALPAMSVAVETGDPIGQVLAQALEAEGDPDLAEQLAQRVPEQTTALREVGAVAAGIAAARRDLTEKARAGRLNDLSNRLSDLGQRELALGAAQQAVELSRALSEAQPDALRPQLAMSLNNLANRLSDLGQWEAALAAAQEAVRHHRALAAARPDDFLRKLAISLTTLANRLSELGQREPALATAQEATDLYRNLAARRTDEFQADLAGSLHNLAIFLSSLGRQVPALAAAQEAVAIRRALAEARPDAFRPNLAASLDNLAINLAQLGQPEPALAAAQEAVDLYRALAAARPDAFRPNLAAGLNNFATHLSHHGQRKAALSAAREAVDLYRVLAAGRSDVYQPGFATSLDNLAARLYELGQRGPALAAAQEAFGILMASLARNPEAMIDAFIRSGLTVIRLLFEVHRYDDIPIHVRRILLSAKTSAERLSPTRLTHVQPIAKLFLALPDTSENPLDEDLLDFAQVVLMTTAAPEE